MAASTTPLKTATPANAAVAAPSVGGSKPVPTSAVETVDATTSTTTSTTTATRWPHLNAGKPIPSTDDWRALERRASSFRLR